MESRRRQLPCHGWVLESLAYDPATGIFQWLKPRQGRRRDRVGGLNGDGYLQARLGPGTWVALHRLAWFYVHGEWPTGEIDHINGDKVDNRIANLRDVCRTVNAQNQFRPQANNRTTGIRGVSFDKSMGKFTAIIGLNGKSKLLGRFRTAEEARLVYLKAKRELHSVAIATVLAVAATSAQAAQLAPDSLLCESVTDLEFASRQDELKGQPASVILKRAAASVEGYRLQAQTARMMSMPRQISAEQAKIDSAGYVSLTASCAPATSSKAEVLERKSISGLVKVRTSYQGRPAELWTFAASVSD